MAAVKSLAQSQAACRAAQDQLTAKQEALAQLQATHDTTTRDAAITQLQLGHANDELKHLRGQAVDLKKRIVELDRAAEELKFAHASLQRELHSRSLELQDSRAEARTLSESIDIAKQSGARLLAAGEHLQQELKLKVIRADMVQWQTAWTASSAAFLSSD